MQVNKPEDDATNATLNGKITMNTQCSNYLFKQTQNIKQQTDMTK